MTAQFPQSAQGPAKIATAADLAKDKLGYTNPNLHRRVNSPAELSTQEKAAGVLDKTYKFTVAGTDSYRTVEIITHDEESETDEVP